MGFIASMLDPSKGAGFQAQGTNILQPTTAADATNAAAQQQAALAQQQQFVNALQAQGGQGMGTQSALTGMLMNTASGQGPNPATAQLAQATGANTANQAALMAGQRGASANPGMMARQAAQQGAANQQGAAGQAATLQAQQSLAAQQQLQGLAATQVGQQASGLGTLNQASLSGQQNILGAIQGQNTANVGMQSNINNANAGVAQKNAETQGGILGGLMAGVGGAMGTLGGGAGGGGTAMAAAMAEGGAVPAGVHPFVHGWKQHCMANGGQVPAMVSPGEIYLPPKAAEKVASGKESPMKAGERIPGKAAVKGDSYANDTVPKTLQEGGIVIPRHAVGSEAEAMAFVKAHFNSRGSRK